MRAIPEVADKDARELRGIVEEWHRQAYPVIGTKPFEDSWLAFLHGWPRVVFPKGVDPLADILKRAMARGLPKIAESYDAPETKLLIAICRELQLALDDRAFFLSCRRAGQVLGIDYRIAAGRFRVLVADGVLKVVKPGTTSRATRYRYLGDGGIGDD